MTFERPQRRRLARFDWGQVINLGERLLSIAHQSIGPKASGQSILAAQYNTILDLTSQLVEGRATLWLPEDLVRRFIGWAPGTKKAEKAVSIPPLTSLMKKALAKQLTCRSQNRLAIATPLFDPGGRTLGVLQIERQPGSRFVDEEIKLIEAVSSQASHGLQTGLQKSLERWRLEQLSLVHQVSAQISHLRELDELSRQVTKLILETFRYYFVAIFTLESGHEQLYFRASAGPARQPSGATDSPSYSPSLRVNLGQGIIGHVAQSGQEVISKDVQHNELYRHLDFLPETRSEVALPLKIEGRILGVLDVQSNLPDDFDETDMLVLRALAGNIAIAVEGARMYNALDRRADQLSAISEVSSAINSILDLERLLNEVVSLIQRRFGYPYIQIYSVHTGRRKVFFEAGSQADSQDLLEKGVAYDLDDPDGLIPWVARHGEVVLVNNIKQDMRFKPASLSPEEAMSELAVPLNFGGEVLGVLDIQSDQPDVFSEEDRFVFETLGSNIAIALRNATLYRSEKWRRQVAESLREVAGILSADADLDQVLEAILAELERTLPLDVAAIWLLDQNDGVDEGQEPWHLHLAAVAGMGTAVLDLHLGLTPEEVLKSNPSLEEELSTEAASSWLREALQSNQPIVRSPNSMFEPLGAALDFPGDYSAISAPLRVGEQAFGVLTLAHRTAGRYGSEARAMTAAFASYAAVAIENTRLFEAAHDQAWISTVLLQVSEATQSLNNLNELLDTVIRITPMLVGVQACLLYMVDDENTFVPTAASGLTSEQRREFERWRFARGDVPALDEMLSQLEPVFLGAEEGDERLSNILKREGDTDQGLHILVPMLARGELLGALLVQYSPSANSGFGSRALEAFLDERLPIIQGIAHQTAIAVENIRLLKSQKEEAYVSVALLQVAQAVVSSTDLDEALEAIVRITPILVGVERAIIFLWDKNALAFRLSQAYGVERDTEVIPFGPGEFPLLDMVHQENRLIAVPCNQTTEENIPEAWTMLQPPDLEQVDRLVAEAPRLLLAFPLSIKEDVLGVLLVEEPEILFSEGLPVENTNRRLRSKRMEIVTGITQQAALAIQNDLLQREMVERERLEREMQLARQIQRTFLPQELPKLKGWELQVRWRTAREVGGDFYDYFELPDGRLGMLIADVADKGMPAALYMTLVRTLIRATIQEIASPAKVLSRVNGILVPDAPQGMFVTLAYAVLDVKTGYLEFSNAGHNPPILVRGKSGKLEHLQRSGMALGVLEDTSIEERTYRLEAEDYLIMYTDGVTEAFSPDGTPYGEEQLSQVISSSISVGGEKGDKHAATAQEVLDAIENSVMQFTKASIPSDDLTLLVLHRHGKKATAGRGGDTPGNLRRATGSTTRGGRAESSTR